MSSKEHEQESEALKKMREAYKRSQWPQSRDQSLSDEDLKSYQENVVSRNIEELGEPGASSTNKWGYDYQFIKKAAAYFAKEIDEEAPDHISEDSDEQKEQLKIILGLTYTGDVRRMGEVHRNYLVKTQKALIQRLSMGGHQDFLSDVLREFIIRPCDMGQIPCPNMLETVRNLIEGGADVNRTDFSDDYQSVGIEYARGISMGRDLLSMLCEWTEDFTHYYRGRHHTESPELMKLILSLTDDITRVAQRKGGGPTSSVTIVSGTPMEFALSMKQSFVPPSNRILFMQSLYFKSLISVVKQLRETPADQKQQERAEHFVFELVKGIDVKELPYLLNKIKAELTSDELDKESISLMREAEAHILEKIYQTELAERKPYLEKSKQNFQRWYFIIPIFIGIVNRIIYAVKNKKATVKVEDLTRAEFEVKYQKYGQGTYKIKFPTKGETDPTLRKAVVFGRNNTGYKTEDLPHLLNGQTWIDENDDAALKTEVRVITAKAA